MPDRHKAEFVDRYWQAEAKIDAILPLMSSGLIDDLTFRSMADLMPTLCWVANGDGYIVWYNRLWHQYCGSTPQSMEGWGWQSVHDPKILPLVLERWTGSIASGEPFEMTFPIRGADGIFRPFITRVQPARDATGQIVRWFGVNTELSAPLATERERLWRTSRDILIVLDKTGTFTSVSPAVTTILGWHPEDLTGRPLFDFVDPDDVALAQLNVRQASERPLPASEIRCVHKAGGFRWLSWVAAPEGDMIFATFRHITEQKEASEALANAEDALRQAHKMEAVGQLTGGLAHDFNNLLAIITGSLDLLSRRIEQGRIQEIDRFLQAAQGATKRASALTHRLLAFSRRQTLDPKQTDINHLVAGMGDMIVRTAGPEIAVETSITDAVWPTFVDPHQLENALLNLCINARDAMPDGGRLTIETSTQDLSAAAASMHDMQPGAYVALSVSDTGTGMPPDVVARAFEPFFTTKPLGQGTGLGLSMIYGFARQSEGQVRIHSEIGHGTTVTIYLPRSHGDVDHQADEAVADPWAAGRGQSVLVVDDEPHIRMMVVDVLEGLGYSAIEAHDGPAALKVLQSDLRIDLLVTDVGMPGGMNGRQVADAGRALRPSLKTLFITGYAETAVVSHVNLDEGMAIITKPFAMSVLANRIQELLATAPAIMPAGRPPSS